MVDEWRRRRRPDEVPTPVAVAVSDFCRRARAPAPATEVRDALAFLSGDEDFRVNGLTDGEPAAQPLGPYAVVDVLRGTAPSLAAERQKVGYYELVRALGDARERPPPGQADATAPTSAPEPAPAPPAAIDSLPPATREGQKLSPGARPSIAERIAPRRRGRAEKRDLPAPRGRFTQLPSARRPIEELLEPSARSDLEALLPQHRHRIGLLKAMAQQYQSHGRPPSEEELLETLARHGLLETLEARERELVLGSYTEQRGAPGRVAWALGLSPAELSHLIQALELKDAVEEIKERFRREALAPKSLAARLDLLGRERYLADLGIKRRYLELAAAELRDALGQAGSGPSSLDEVTETTARRHGTTAAVLRRAMEQLGLSAKPGASRREGAPSPPEPES